MGKGDLAGLRAAAATYQRRRGSGVVRMSERSLRPAAERYVAGYRLNRRHLQGLAFIQRRQEAGQTAGEQGFAGARRAAEQQIVRPGGSDQQRALGCLLALDFIQIGIRTHLQQQAIGGVGIERCLPVEVGDQLQQMPDRKYHQA
ncbi:hypothetical protein D9M73_229930 [compost metagenome]